MWQELAVGIIVALAASYVGAKYLPERWRRSLVRRLSQGASRSVLANRLLKWLDTSASCGSGSGSGGGGGCGSCGNGKATEPTPSSGKGRVIKIHQRR